MSWVAAPWHLGLAGNTATIVIVWAGRPQGNKDAPELPACWLVGVGLAVVPGPTASRATKMFWKAEMHVPSSGSFARLACGAQGGSREGSCEVVLCITSGTAGTAYAAPPAPTTECGKVRLEWELHYRVRTRFGNAGRRKHAHHDDAVDPSDVVEQDDLQYSTWTHS